MKLRNVLSKKTEDETPKVTEEELETIIETMVDDGEIDSDDAELMRGMIDSNNRTVYDIMVPRVDIIAIDIESTIDEIKEIFFKYKFSRIPVFRDDKDHIIGILNERDFFTALIEHKKINIEKMVSKPLYVSMEMKSDDLIRKMQKEKKHFAIVADEYGGTGGIVTLEDAIEVITGEIYDEHDDVDDIKDYIKQVEDNQYIIDAEMPIEDLFELLELGKAPESRYSNIGGFLYGLGEELPTLGQNFDYDANVYKQDEDGMTEEFLIKLHFSVIEVIERRIKKIKLIVDEPINLEVEDKDEE
jgi:CBS domain containing-hemolysin-like protein